MFTLGPRNQIITLDTDINIEGNATLYPDLDAVFPLPWASDDEIKVAEIFGEPWCDGKPLDMTPRYLLRKQFEKLHDMGFSLMSSFELEFMIINGAGEPLTEDGCCSTLMLAKHEKFLYGISKNLKAAGVEIEAINLEYAEGQVEMTLVPAFGIKAIDNAVFAKSAIKELCQKEGYQAVFMSKPFKRLLGLGNGSHYNHSLWDHSGKKNMMFEENDSKHMSALHRHWVAGLKKHGCAITALSCPTVNCYRRLHRPWAPDRSDWGLDDRQVSFRVKAGSPASTYVENRLPSGSFNPYLAVAATIAAGIDGITNKLELGKEKSPDDPLLPHNLGEALDMLEDDTVMVESLGKTFVEWFCLIKRDIEIKELQDVDLKDESNEGLAKERDMYMTFC